jgi:flagellar biosynthesis anti-sigma factor FlgM
LERPAEVSSGPQKSVANPPPGTDSVRVSDQAAAIGELTAKADQLPEIRQEKVERLRTEVQSGNYRPPAAEIADALLKDGAKSTVEI